MYPKLYIDFTIQSQLPFALKCTRATIGYAFNASRRLVQFAANKLRVGFDGLIIEPAATNLFNTSKNLTTWTKTGTATIVSATSIDSTFASIGLTAYSASATVTFEKSVSGSGAHTLSFYATNVNNNVIRTVTFGGTTTSIKNGYNEVVGNSPTSVLITITTNSFSSTSFIDKIDAVQVEAGSTATSHIVTTGSTVTRNADEVYIEINQALANNWFDALNGTFLVDCITNKVTTEQVLLNLVNTASPTTDYMRAAIERNTDTALKVGYDNNKKFTFFSVCDNPGNAFRFGTTYVDTEQLVSLYGRTQTNGDTLTTSLDFSAINRLYIGRYHDGTNLFSGKLQRLGYYDVACDQPTLNQLTYR